MNSITLANNAELCISAMHLPSDQAESVRITIKNYSSPQSGCSETLRWLAFRVINIIKAIFGRSDWQKAKNIIKNHAIHLVNESLKNEGKPALYPTFSSKFSIRVHWITDLLASELLTLSFKIHNQKIEVSNRYDRKNPDATISEREIEEMDLTGAALYRIKALEFCPGVKIGKVSILLD